MDKSAENLNEIVKLHNQYFDSKWDSNHLFSQGCEMLFEPNFAYVLYKQVLDEAEIIEILVAKTRRRAGIAKKLMQEAISKLKLNNCTRVLLEVAEDNLAATSLYKKLGFTQYGKRQNYYKNKDGSRADAILFELKL